jgi:hypothetical protein
MTEISYLSPIHFSKAWYEVNQNVPTQQSEKGDFSPSQFSEVTVKWRRLGVRHEIMRPSLCLGSYPTLEHHSLQFAAVLIDIKIESP